jgi:hypothetical protein
MKDETTKWPLWKVAVTRDETVECGLPGGLGCICNYR